jgi:lipopolysaccharide export system protein LptA
MRLARAAAIAVLALAPLGAMAQDFGKAFSGFNTGSDQPIQIEADQLEVRDPEKVAIYSGHVRVRQGGTLLEAPTLRVFYTGDAPGAGGGTTGAGGSSSAGGTAAAGGTHITHLEAGPGVMVRDGDRTASSDKAVLDMDTNLVTMTGNVVLTEGPNVVRGQRFVVNLATNEGRIDGGRVQTLITPPSDKQPKP